MPENVMSAAEMQEIFGGDAEAIQSDPDEIAVGLALRAVRARLMEAAKEDRVGVNQLASRLDISPSSVSRLLGGEGDMRVSTAVLYARALGRQWAFVLQGDPACTTGGNHHPIPPMTIAPASARGASSSAVLPISVMGDPAGPAAGMVRQIQVKAFA